MVIDLNKYRYNVKPVVKQWCDSRQGTLSEKINALTQMTSCPILYIAHYVGELYGFEGEVQTIIDSLIAFYRPDEIINLEVKE